MNLSSVFKQPGHIFSRFYSDTTLVYLSLFILLHDNLSEFKVISVTFIPSYSNFADTKAIFNYFMEMFKKEVEISFVVGSKCQDYFEVHTKKHAYFSTKYSYMPRL